MKRVFLDTNALLLLGTHKLDVFSEVDRIIQDKYELCVVQETIKELEKLTNTAKKGSDKHAAKLALVLLKQKNLKRVRSFFSTSVADDALLHKTHRGDVVVTQDKDLKKALQAKGVHVMTLRQRTHLVMT